MNRTMVPAEQEKQREWNELIEREKDRAFLIEQQRLADLNDYEYCPSGEHRSFVRGEDD